MFGYSEVKWSLSSFKSYTYGILVSLSLSFVPSSTGFAPTRAWTSSYPHSLDGFEKKVCTKTAVSLIFTTQQQIVGLKVCINFSLLGTYLAKNFVMNFPLYKSTHGPRQQQIIRNIFSICKYSLRPVQG